ncbi:MAG: outer membrane protein assembly factor BamE [Spirochaetales bacterium]|jgi:hypothetical protein|nr:outer membrane protein assembly factor BamE [Spirochaetales bacterium]
MRRLLRGVVPVILFLAGCCTPSQPDISIAAIFPRASGGFALADPEYAVYDLSKLRIGMTRTEVYTLFAKPHTVKHAPRDEYWEYDWFELYFREGRLVNWFDLPAERQKISPSSRSSQADRRGVFEGL